MARGTVVRPDFELTINDAEGSAVLVVGFFIEENGMVDLGIGWDGTTEITGVRALLETAALGLSGAITFTGLDNLVSENEGKKSEGDQLPF